MRAAEMQQSSRTLRFPRQNSLSGIRSWDVSLGLLLAFTRRKQGAISSPSLSIGSFPLWHFVPLRNLRGWTLPDIMQIKNTCPSPNRLSIWIIFSRVRCFWKAWGNIYATGNIPVTLLIQMMPPVDTYEVWSPQLSAIQKENWPSLPQRLSTL